MAFCETSPAQVLTAATVSSFTSRPRHGRDARVGCFRLAAASTHNYLVQWAPSAIGYILQPLVLGTPKARRGHQRFGLNGIDEMMSHRRIHRVVSVYGPCPHSSSPGLNFLARRLAFLTFCFILVCCRLFAAGCLPTFFILLCVRASWLSQSESGSESVCPGYPRHCF